MKSKHNQSITNKKAEKEKLNKLFPVHFPVEIRGIADQLFK